MSKSGYEFTLNELLGELFLHLIHNYSLQAKNELKDRIGNLITKLRQVPDLGSAITHSDGKYKVDPSGPVKFKNSCMKLIKKYEEEKKRRTLHDWMK